MASASGTSKDPESGGLDYETHLSPIVTYLQSMLNNYYPTRKNQDELALCNPDTITLRARKYLVNLQNRKVLQAKNFLVGLIYIVCTLYAQSANRMDVSFLKMLSSQVQKLKIGKKILEKSRKKIPSQQIVIRSKDVNGAAKFCLKCIKNLPGLDPKSLEELIKPESKHPTKIFDGCYAIYCSLNLLLSLMTHHSPVYSQTRIASKQQKRKQQPSKKIQKILQTVKNQVIKRKPAAGSSKVRAEKPEREPPTGSSQGHAEKPAAKNKPIKRKQAGGSFVGLAGRPAAKKHRIKRGPAGGSSQGHAEKPAAKKEPIKRKQAGGSFVGLAGGPTAKKQRIKRDPAGGSSQGHPFKTAVKKQPIKKLKKYHSAGRSTSGQTRRSADQEFEQYLPAGTWENPINEAVYRQQPENNQSHPLAQKKKLPDIAIGLKAHLRAHEEKKAKASKILNENNSGDTMTDTRSPEFEDLESDWESSQYSSGANCEAQNNQAPGNNWKPYQSHPGGSENDQAAEKKLPDIAIRLKAHLQAHEENKTKASKNEKARKVTIL
ncbi:hypothetical protein Ciccas_012801 [Cichlidogyrus casuarinus]|uniref:Uncharacterized protein n=1 Tax=Cichlidogyrus casuarinus TaxID=1844966 RepID=A0ABD2PMA5_9PLAT